ncbi:MAG: PPOX class F420-dependent oxidoreductase [Actinomycetia bacterium]|nr:PPOX class F420-dependent oxidoreductase [Actinomycetes bacterium]
MGYTDAPTRWWQEFIEELPARTAKLAVVRKDGSPHVAPVWVALDHDNGHDDPDIVFLTAADTLKGRCILRDPRVSMCLDDERPPFSFLTVSGAVTTSTDADELLHWATATAARYMGAEQAEAYGRRNAVPGEMVVRLHPERIVAKVAVADF